ncbi:Holliday junction resolvase RecU [Jeotgalibacillus terrae]|uniref:Holliday junction resolvase RecU n=1 Tax=Jeotgalibacillus terrae TaxID=587735 RepID=A0ABW5ZH32_9BACL|nr:Holliday junction resolvase RecU [Jeotgalibacillus terrae]MBM7580048.1 recombination protein U [Jeotgalibacillus terrae]
MKSRSHANRGKTLEIYIDQANATYQQRGQAVVVRQHPEVKVTGFKDKKVTDGFYKSKGAPDYIGLASNLPVCFDAKETKSETSFPIDNVHQHQIKDLKHWEDQGGFSFLIIRFVTHKKTYLLPFKAFNQCLKECRVRDVKSIPYQVIQQRGKLITAGSNITLDWLTAAWEVRE